MTAQEFEAAGELGRVAAQALPALKELPGFLGLRIVNEALVVTGTGDEVQQAAQELGARFETPGTGAPGTDTPAEVPQDAGAALAADPSAVPAEAGVVEPGPGETGLPAPAPAESDGTVEPEDSEDPEDAAAPGAAKYAADVASLRAAYVARFGYTGLQSVMWNGSSYVIKVDKAALGAASTRSRTAVDPVEDFVSEYANVSVAAVTGPTEPLAEEPENVEPENVVNGQGYAGIGAAGLAVCSIGFSAFTPTGEPAALSAGHCSMDGMVSETVLTDPAGDSAGIGPDESGTFPWMELGDLQSKLGTFGFSQFGGPGHAATPISPGGLPLPDALPGSDISVIDGINPALDLLPETTQWLNPADLTETAVEVTGTAAPTIGAPVCKSGRTTGWSCGIITGLGEFPVPGHRDPEGITDIRLITGFETDLNAAVGDSGGAVVSGGLALGMVSAGGARTDADGTVFPVMYAVDLASALPLTGGYTVRVHVAEPALTSVADGGTVYPGGQLSGAAPAGTTVEASISGGAPVSAAVAMDGTWTLPLPEDAKPGTTVELALRALSGFSASTTVSYELTVDYPQLDAPAITSPAAGTAVTAPVTEVAGTGTPGATVTLTTGANPAARALPLGTAEVSASGAWSIELDPALGYGEHVLNATQDGVAERSASAPASMLLSVIYPAPLITSVQDGQVFEFGQAPETVSGTGFPGAQVSLGTGAETSTGTVNADGEWTVQIPAPAAGEHVLTAAQQLDGVPSLTSSITITVNEMQAAPVGTPTPLPTDPGSGPAAGTDPAPAGAGTGLADTGASGRLGLFGVVAAVLVVLGIATMVINRRSRKN